MISVRNSCCCLGACDKDGFMCPSIWSKLPNDLFIELLQRLPEEASLQFRCVSKDSNFVISRLFLPKLAAYARVSGFVFQWQRTIYPPRYYRTSYKFRQQKKSPPPKDYYGYVTETGGSYAHKGGELVKSYLSLLPFEPNTDDFLGCFNGFFLVRNSSFVPIGYYVCNPATRQCLAIPLNPQHLLKDSFVGLAFDPLDRPSSPYHDFKIVRVDCPIVTWSSSLNHQQPRRREMDVFSSATGKWVNYQIPLEPEILEFHWNMRSIFVNGVFYMLSMRKYLLCFDLNNTEEEEDNAALKARAIRLPPRSRSDCIGIFEISNGCLYYACKVDDELLVWTFQVGNEASPCWTLKYNFSTIDLARLSFGHFLNSQTSIFAVDTSAEVIYVGSVYMVFTYDIKNDKVEEFGRINYGYIVHATSLCFYPYSCCLVRLSDQFSLN